MFETAAVPIAGAHPQAIINSQGLKDADIVFAVFGSRIGSPTPDAISGTVEELEAAIKAGKPEIAYSNFDYASLLTEAFLLGNVAIRTGKKLAWDGPALKITNVPEANRYIQTHYRRGWEVTRGG